MGGIAELEFCRPLYGGFVFVEMQYRADAFVHLFYALLLTENNDRNRQNF